MRFIALQSFYFFLWKIQYIHSFVIKEIWEFAREDLLALSEMLGDSPFLLGDTPSTVDCTLFGHLAQFLYIDIGEDKYYIY